MTEITHDELEAAVAELAERAGTHPVTIPNPDWEPNKKFEVGDTINIDGKGVTITDVGPSDPPATEELEKADPVVPPQMTKKVWKEMMRIHFTVRRPLVKSCGHKINIQTDPKNNCPDCWFAYFQNNGQMTQIADECFTQAGRDVLERSRGKKFVKYFLRFMSTIARFQREAAAAAAEKEKANGEEQISPDSTALNGTGDRGGDSSSHTSIGGLAGEAQSIGGVSANPSVNDYVAEDPVDGGSAEGLGTGVEPVRQRLGD